MIMYLVKTPNWIKYLYPDCIWDKKDVHQKVVYLTFDDGPHPIATPFVLDCLLKFNAKGNFFCIGNNVEKHPAIFSSILEQGHLVGNHTFHHLRGWAVDTHSYIEDIKKAQHLIQSPFFRPPYGRIKRDQIRNIQQDPSLPQKIIMWDVLSGDFDLSINGEKCADNVIRHALSGSIIVFHDSQKAWDRLCIALPKVLSHFAHLGFEFKRLDQ